MKKLLVCGALVWAMAAVAEDAPRSPQKPGRWTVTMQMEMTGVPVKMPPVSVDVCVTEEDLKNPEKSVPTDAKQQCKVSDYKVDGDTVSWTMDCPKSKTHGTGEITYSEDSYSGRMKMKVGEQEMTTKMTGTWKGECTK